MTSASFSRFWIHEKGIWCHNANLTQARVTSCYLGLHNLSASHIEAIAANTAAATVMVTEVGGKGGWLIHTSHTGTESSTMKMDTNSVRTWLTTFRETILLLTIEPCPTGQCCHPYPHPFPHEPVVTVHFFFLPHIRPEDGDSDVHCNTKTASNITWHNPANQSYMRHKSQIRIFLHHQSRELKCVTSSCHCWCANLTPRWCHTCPRHGTGYHKLTGRAAENLFPFPSHTPSHRI